MQIQQLMKTDAKSWNKELIEELIIEKDATLIQTLRLTSQPAPDLLG